MDLDEIYTGIADAVRDRIPTLNCFGFVPDSLPDPSFYVGDMEIDYDKSVGGGMEELTISCYVLVSRADPKSAHAALFSYVPGTGPTSIKAAIEHDRTLGGVVEDVRVLDFRTLTGEEIAQEDRIGGVWTLTVLAQSEQD